MLSKERFEFICAYNYKGELCYMAYLFWSERNIYCPTTVKIKGLGVDLWS